MSHLIQTPWSVLLAAEHFPAAEKSGKRRKGKDLAEGLEAGNISFTPGNGGATQGSKKKKGTAGMGGHTLMKLLGKRAGPPCRGFLAGGRTVSLCLLC